MRTSVLALAVVFSFLIPLPLLSGDSVMGSGPDDIDMGVRGGMGDYLTNFFRDLITQSPEPSVTVTPTPTPSPSLFPEPSPIPTVCSVCFVEINGYVRDAITAAPIEGAIVEYKHIISAFNESTEADCDGYYLINYARHCEDLSTPVEISCAAEGYLRQSVWERIYCWDIHNISFNLIPGSSPQPSASVTPPPTIPPTITPISTVCCVCPVDIEGYVRDGVTSEPIEGATVEYRHIIFYESEKTDNTGYYRIDARHCEDLSTPIEIFCSAEGYLSDSAWKRLFCWNIHNVDFYLTPEPLVGFSTCASGDYDGDGTSDIAIFRPSSGLWAVRDLTRFYFGGVVDRPVSGDYNGDGTAEAGYFRSSGAWWAIRGMTRFSFGVEGDQAVPGDYNGDGTAEAGVFRDGPGLWVVRGGTRAYFGGEGDIPVPGDYRGDGISEVAIFRPPVGLWAIRGLTRLYFGREGDRPLPGDYDGDGSADWGVYRPGTGLWAVRGNGRTYYGRVGDCPVPAEYGGAGTDEVAIFRPGNGLWAVRGLSRLYFGKTGDIPVTR